MLGGSWAVISAGISRVITHIRGLVAPFITTLNLKPYRILKGALPITPFITTYEPPSAGSWLP